MRMKELKNKIGKKRKAFVWIILAAILLLVAVTVIVFLFVQRNVKKADEYASYVTISGETITEKITSEEDAVSVLSEAGPELGYQNAFSELTPSYSGCTEGVTCYQMQQNYEGIPVYGHTVSVLTDESGNALLLSGNFKDIDRIINQQTASADNLQQALSDHFGDSAQILTDPDYPNGRPYLYAGDSGLSYVYSFSVYQPGNQGGIYETLIDAQTGDVVQVNELIFDATGYTASDTEKENGFPVEQIDNRYVLIDREREIIILNLNGQSSQDKICTDINIWTGKKTYDYIDHWERGSLVESDNEIFGDTDTEQQNKAEDGAQLLLNMENIMDYFQTYGYYGNSPILLYYQDGYQDGTNARGGAIGKELQVRVVSIGKNRSVDSLDVLGHEYTHAVANSTKRWDDNVQTSAICEAVSDIMGELSEAWVMDTEPDWVMADARSIREPYEGFLRSQQQFLENPNINYYNASTIISHAGYLMWNGIDGDPDARIDLKTLGALWYISMLDFPYDVSFERCGYIVETMAAIFNSRGLLSNEQLLCVEEAFAAVGIEGRIDINDFAEQLKQEAQQRDDISAEITDPAQAYAEALSMLQGTDFSVTVQGKLTTEFVGCENIEYEKTVNVYDYGLNDMTVNGNYTSSDGDTSSSNEKNYFFSCQPGQMEVTGQIAGYVPSGTFTYKLTSPIFTLELPPQLYQQDWSAPDTWGAENHYSITLNAGKLTNESIGILNNVLPQDFSVYWGEGISSENQNGVESAVVDFTVDESGNFTSITVTYQLWGAVQDISPINGSTTFTFSPTKNSGLWGVMPKTYSFTTGAGGVTTQITLKSDGTFTGQYQNFAEEPNADPIYFYGVFSDLTMLDSHSFTAKLKEFDFEDESKAAMNEYEKESIVSMHGFQTGNEFCIYLPGQEIATLPEKAAYWWQIIQGGFISNDSGKLPFFVIYCEKAGGGFYPSNILSDFDYTNLVTDAYNEKIGERQFSIPQINLKSVDCERINAEIWDTLYTGVVANLSLENIDGGEYIRYEWTAVNGILSLLIECHPVHWAWTEYYVYNVDISEGVSLSNDEVISSVGITSADYSKRAQEALGSYYWSNWERDNENFYNQYFVDTFNQCLKNTLSTENINATTAYLNNDGQLCMVAKIYSMAGAEYYWHSINLSDYQLLPNYADEASLLVHKINISEDEAYTLACEYWNYAPGCVDEDTGYELFLVYDGISEKNNGNHYYVFRLRWWVPEEAGWGNHMSTIDYLYINAENGECMSQI